MVMIEFYGGPIVLDRKILILNGGVIMISCK